jgi:hypothetical protein
VSSAEAVAPASEERAWVQVAPVNNPAYGVTMGQPSQLTWRCHCSAPDGQGFEIPG